MRAAGARASRPGASAEFGKLGGPKAGRSAERRSRAGVGVMLGHLGARAGRARDSTQRKAAGWGSGEALGQWPPGVQPAVTPG